jgi:hypothetical protein
MAGRNEGLASGVQCCFCGATIAPVSPDPVRLEVRGENGETQELYCHAAHLKRALHPSVPLYIWEVE